MLPYHLGAFVGWSLANRSGRSLLLLRHSAFLAGLAYPCFYSPHTGPIAVAELVHADLGWGYFVFGTITGLLPAMIHWIGPWFW